MEHMCMSFVWSCRNIFYSLLHNAICFVSSFSEQDVLSVVSLKMQHLLLNLVQAICSLVETESAFYWHGGVMETLIVKMDLMKKAVVCESYLIILLMLSASSVFH